MVSLDELFHLLFILSPRLEDLKMFFDHFHIDSYIEAHLVACAKSQTILANALQESFKHLLFTETLLNEYNFPDTVNRSSLDRLQLMVINILIY